LLQVPANRAGYTTMSLAQLKVLQEVITLLVLSSIRFALHASAHQTQFSLGRSVPCRRSLFHVPSIKFQKRRTYENKRSIQPEKVSEGRRNFYRGFGNQRSREFVRQRRRKERERGLTAGRFDARARRAQTHSAHLRRSHPADR